MKHLHQGQEKLPAHARLALHTIGAQLRSLASEINRLETQILAWHRADDTSRRLATIPDIGPSRQPWLAQLRERKPVKIATVGLANKTARIAWAVMTRKECYADAAA